MAGPVAARTASLGDLSFSNLGQQHGQAQMGVLTQGQDRDLERSVCRDRTGAAFQPRGG